MSFEAAQRRIARLLQLALVAGAIATILWTVAVPNLGPGLMGGGRPNADESAAIATLKNVHSGQLQFRALAAIDRDGDARGEFGWLGELAAARALRGSAHGHRLDPPLLSTTFGRQQSGRVQRSGHLIQLWLPSGHGGWCSEGASGTVDPDAAETGYCCYAWPTDASHGRRVFFIDADGEVRASQNRAGYCGHERPVPVDAALPSSNVTVEDTDASRTGRDGEVWVVVQ